MALLITRMRHVRGVLIVFLLVAVPPAHAQEPPPALTQPVNDFANVIDAESEAALDALIRSLQNASGDAVVVATIDTFAPYGDIREYAVEMFENRGKGIGGAAEDNGLLVLLAVSDREVWVEVGYGLEEFITDGFAGETSRQYMLPHFRQGAYGPGLYAGVQRIISRVAERRNVTLQGVPRYADDDDDADGLPPVFIIIIFILFVLMNMSGRTRRRRRGWWAGPGTGWHSGVGPFGGGFGGGFGSGGGFGGGFGGFGGGGSGGGGGGASW